MSGQQLSGPAQELYARVQAAMAGTMYTVFPTEDGFEVAVDVRAPQWHWIIGRHRVEKVLTHRVSLDGATRRYTVTDVLRRLEWTEVGGNRHLVIGASVEVDSGRVWHHAKMVSFGSQDDGRFGVDDTYTFSSPEGRQLITDSAAALGWTRQGSTQMKVGVAVGVVAGVGALVAVLLAVIIPALTG